MKTLVIIALLMASSGAVFAEPYTMGDFFKDIVVPGERKGLTVRVDIGGGTSMVDAEHESWSPTAWSKDQGSIGSVFGVGVGVSNQVVVEGTVRLFAYGEASPWLFLLGPIGILLQDKHATAGAGVTYYVRPGIPSWFFEAGVGGSVISNPFDDDLVSRDYDGIGYFVGTGYEFSRHIHVGAQWYYMQNSSSNHYREGKWTGSSLIATLGVRLY